MTWMLVVLILGIVYALVAVAVASMLVSEMAQRRDLDTVILEAARQAKHD